MGDRDGTGQGEVVCGVFDYLTNFCRRLPGFWSLLFKRIFVLGCDIGVLFYLLAAGTGRRDFVGTTRRIDFFELATNRCRTVWTMII